MSAAVVDGGRLAMAAEADVAMEWVEEGVADVERRMRAEEQS